MSQSRKYLVESRIVFVKVSVLIAISPLIFLRRISPLILNLFSPDILMSNSSLLAKRVRMILEIYYRKMKKVKSTSICVKLTPLYQHLQKDG